MKFPMRFAGLLALALGLVAPCVRALDGVGRQTAHSFSTEVTTRYQLGYLLHTPAAYDADPGRKWPLVLFLHGAGERGTKLALVAKHGPPKLVAAGQDLPFILVSPQCPEGQWWSDAALIALLDEVQKTHRVDPARVYVTGLSMGGYGTWALISRHPERFAAAAPICGGGERLRTSLLSEAQLTALKSLPIRVYHGGKDPTVALSESERMIAFFKQAGATDIQLTVYPEAGHDSWTQTYANPDFFRWLLAQHR